MKSILLLFTVLILSFDPLFAQTTILSEESSKVQAESLFKAGEKQMNAGSYGAAISYFEKSLLLYESLHLPDETGNSQKQIATAYYYQGNYTKALEFFSKSRYSYQQAKNKIGESRILNNMGAVYYYLGNKLKALELYKQAIALQKVGGDRKIFAATTQNIGGIYVSIKDYKNGMAYFQQALKLQVELKDSVSLSQTLNGIGEIYMRQQNYAKAYPYLHQSLALANKLDHKMKQLEVLYNLGELCNRQKTYTEALSYYHQALAIAEKISSLQYISNVRIALGDVFIKTRKITDAVKECETGLTIAEKLESVTLKKEACDCLYKSHKLLGNSRLALGFYEKATTYKDSLRSEEIASQAQNMEFRKQQLADSVAHARKEYLIQQKHKEEVRKKEQQRNYIFLSLGFLSVVAVGLWSRLNYVRKSKKILQKEKDRSENLLLNILPRDIADELMEKGSVEAQNFSSVAILFSDFKSFTQTAEQMSPQSLVEELNVCFRAFDLIVDKYKIEKIKTIGDAYMAAGGLPIPDQQATQHTVLAALEMQDFITRRKLDNQSSNNPAFEMRVGVHSGPVVAGIVGVKKFQYDVWGDTVNTASRIESNGEPGKVNVSESVYNLLKDDPTFLFDYRGVINAKGKGEIKMYFVKKA